MRVELPTLAKQARVGQPLLSCHQQKTKSERWDSTPSAMDYFFGCDCDSDGFGGGIDACSLVGGTMFFIRM